VVPAGAPHGNAYFRDTQVELAGPCAGALARLVEDVAGLARGPLARATEPPEGASLVLVHESHVRRARRSIQRALRMTLARALERVTLTSPYFVPPGRLVRALVHARRRGVDVRILTAGRSDVPLVRLASQHLYGRLLRHGIRIFELERRTLHAKTATIDGVYATVGSFNLDHWSDRRNLEVTVGLLDPAATAELERQFELDLAGAREVELANWERRSWFERVLGWLAYQLLRL
jgi:cardiolipin synthase